MIDLTISVCLESNGTCMLVETVLDKTVLPKTVCDWSSGLQGRFYVTVPHASCEKNTTLGSL